MSNLSIETYSIERGRPVTPETQDWRWYVAELVVEANIAGDSRNVIHINSVLVHAHSPEDAYRKALELGNSEETQYANPAGSLVRWHFRGLREIWEMYEPPEHGAEVAWEEKFGLSGEEIKNIIRPEHLLSIFRDPQPHVGTPDYSSGEIVSKAMKMVEKQRPEQKFKAKRKRQSKKMIN